MSYKYKLFASTFCSVFGLLLLILDVNCISCRCLTVVGVKDSLLVMATDCTLFFCLFVCLFVFCFLSIFLSFLPLIDWIVKRDSKQGKRVNAMQQRDTRFGIRTRVGGTLL